MRTPYSSRSPSAGSTHNSLSGIQGGASSDYYHLTAAEREIALINAANNKIVTDTTIPENTSHVAVSYLEVEATFYLSGNLLVIG